MAKFFIDRPIFAWVISIFIIIAGVLGINNLPISQYPEILPPQISVDANYSGASAEVVADTVAVRSPTISSASTIRAGA